MNETLFPGLPAFCYAPDPYNKGLPAMIYPGDSVYYGAKQAVSATAAAAGVDALNAVAGVTPAQAKAMLAGVQHGWSDPRANPAAYDAQGNLPPVVYCVHPITGQNCFVRRSSAWYCTISHDVDVDAYNSTLGVEPQHVAAVVAALADAYGTT